MITLYIISVAVFALFISTVIVINGVPKSISESYYILGEKVDLLASMFTFFCWLTAIPLLIFWLENDGGILAFVACGALCFVGAAPMFKSHEKTIHFVSAIVCFVSAYVWLILYADLSLVVTSILVIIFASFLKNKIFWIELTAFLTIYLALI